VKTIYALFWTSEDDQGYATASTTWLETRDGGDQTYDELVAEGHKPTLFSFSVEDDADEDIVSEILDDFMVGRVHIADMLESQILQ
jgi:hypothetical protein